jgi:hypothetical protein
MELRRVGSVAAFLGLAGEFLAAREAEHNLIFGICSAMLGDPTMYPEPPYLGVVIDGDHVVAAAMRTPPRPLILSETDVPEAVDVVLGDLVGTSLPGVLGPAALSAAFAEQWAARRAIRCGSPCESGHSGSVASSRLDRSPARCVP